MHKLTLAILLFSLFSSSTFAFWDVRPRCKTTADCATSVPGASCSAGHCNCRIGFHSNYTQNASCQAIVCNQPSDCMIAVPHEVTPELVCNGTHQCNCKSGKMINDGLKCYVASGRGVIIAAVVGVILVLALGTLLLWWYLLRDDQSKNEPLLVQQQLQTAEEEAKSSGSNVTSQANSNVIA